VNVVAASVLAAILHAAGGIPMILPVPVTTHVVSAPENPVPVIVTTVPTEPELGARLIVGRAATAAFSTVTNRARKTKVNVNAYLI